LNGFSINEPAKLKLTPHSNEHIILTAPGRVKFMYPSRVHQSSGIYHQTFAHWLLKTALRKTSSSPHLALAEYYPFVGGELFEAHGAAGVELLGGDAYLRPQAELPPIGKSR